MDAEFDSDSDDQRVMRKTSTELAAYDREVVLQHEEETERILAAAATITTNKNSDFPSTLSTAARQRQEAIERKAEARQKQRREKEEARRSRKDQRKSRKRSRNQVDEKDEDDEQEKGELLYSAATAIDDDSDVEDEYHGGDQDHDHDASPVGEREYTMLDEKKRRRRRRRAACARFCSYCCIYLLIAVVVVVLVLAAYKATNTTKVRNHALKPLRLLSNGTALFGPTTILISLDGFRADFLDRGLTPALNFFIANGVSPKYMTPSFPSVTFPNHFTLVTGLYPESHGVVGNTFWDPKLKEDFYYTHTDVSMQSKWWNAEPLWVTAEHQGAPVAVHMWPGSEAHIGDVEPTYLDKFNGNEKLSNKVDRILGLLDLPGWEKEEHVHDIRPQLIAAYVPNVDADGHLYGPNSTEIRQTIREADDMLAYLLEGLELRNLTDVVNVVVVSDHGMATTDVSRLVQLEDIVDTSLIEHIDGWPHYGLRPKDSADIDAIYTRLKQHANQDGAFQVFLRDENMPERYHFSNNERIAPIWIFPETGWAIVTMDEMDVKRAQANNEVYHPRGIHGYDHEHPLMRAIFIARGPAFPHTPGSRVASFQNIEVYNILCDSIGIKAHANNGTLHLPLQTIGLHSDDDDDEHEVVEDPPSTQPTKKPDGGSDDKTTPVIHGDGTVHGDDGGDSGGDDDQMTEAEELELLLSWEEWVKAKYEGLNNWLNDFLGITQPPSV